MLATASENSHSTLHSRGWGEAVADLNPPQSPQPEAEVEPDENPTESALLSEQSADDQPRRFFDENGEFDISEHLSSITGVLPLVMPITEPAVGYGLTIGLTYFHRRPSVEDRDGQKRVIMPSISTVFGFDTQSGSWGAGMAHSGVWDEGRIRYLGAFGYASLNLDWYGRSEQFGGRSISYDNDVQFLLQRITFQLGDSDFFIGPQYKFINTDAEFDLSEILPGIPPAEFDSRTAGLGLALGYDSRDEPFSPTRGVRAELLYSQQDQALGGDFDYGRLNAYGIVYQPITEQLVLGVHADAGFILGEAPFYDLPGLIIRGLDRGRYVDDAAVLLETELRYDITNRWTVIGFGGAGRVAGSFEDLLDASAQWAGGAGFRYLIAEEYGLRMGVDLAYGDDEAKVYITVGTGWFRP